MIEKEDLVQTILLIQLGLLFLLLLGVSVINYIINKRLWKPFYYNLAILQNFRLENPVLTSTERSKIREFEQLNNSIHQLTISVHSAYLSQKEFTENASHELQTPLALLKSKLELLLQDSNLSRSQSLLIDDMNTVVVQLEQLNINLLFLSKIENNQFAGNQTIQADQIIFEVAKELSFMVEAKQLYLEFQNPNIHLKITANQHLFKAMITNLFRNAIQYSDPGSIIKVEIALDFFSIKNVGGSFGAQQTRLFQRFSGMGNQKGTGLGLAIAKKIADLNQLQLEYAYIDGWHCFRISW